jgi:hypothetical protein
LSRGFSLNRWFLPIGENPISVENTYSTLAVMVFKCLLVFFQIILKGLKLWLTGVLLKITEGLIEERWTPVSKRLPPFTGCRERNEDHLLSVMQTRPFI